MEPVGVAGWLVGLWSGNADSRKAAMEQLRVWWDRPSHRSFALCALPVCAGVIFVVGLLIGRPQSDGWQAVEAVGTVGGVLVAWFALRVARDQLRNMVGQLTAINNSTKAAAVTAVYHSPWYAASIGDGNNPFSLPADDSKAADEYPPQVQGMSTLVLSHYEMLFELEEHLGRGVVKGWKNAFGAAVREAGPIRAIMKESIANQAGSAWSDRLIEEAKQALAPENPNGTQGGATPLDPNRPQSG